MLYNKLEEITGKSELVILHNLLEAKQESIK